MINFNNYLKAPNHVEEATITRYLGGAISKKTVVFTFYKTCEKIKEESSLDIYIFGIKIWHQEKMLVSGRNGETKVYL